MSSGKRGEEPKGDSLNSEIKDAPGALGSLWHFNNRSWSRVWQTESSGVLKEAPVVNLNAGASFWKQSCGLRNFLVLCTTWVFKQVLALISTR